MADALVTLLDETVTVSVAGTDLLAPMIVIAEAAVAAQAAIEALLLNSDLSQSAVVAEFAGGAAGAIYIPDKAYLYQDAAMTTPVTASGQLVGCIKNVLSTASNDYDLIQATAGSRPTYYEAFGVGYVSCGNGKFLYSRANVPFSCPGFMGIAASHVGTSGRAIFGFVKNTGSRFQLLSGALDGVEAAIDGTTDIAGRTPAVRPVSAQFSAPHDVVNVVHTLSKAGLIDSVFEDSTFRDSSIEVVSAWANGNTVTGCSLVLNGSGQSLGIGTANADASCDFYGGVVIASEPANRSAVVRWLQSRARPPITADDEIIVIVGDSTSDDVGTDTAAYGEELGMRFARDALVSRRASNCVMLQNWNRLGDCFMGMERFSDGTLSRRTFVINCSSAGSQPGYFFGERFADTLALLPKIDTVIWNHGHNLPVGDATIQADTNRKYYRAGEYMDAQDQLRAAFPDAQHMMIRPYPVGIAADARIEPVIKAVDHVAAKYGDVTLVDLYTPWDVAGRLSAWYCADKVHPSIPTGVTQMLNPLVTAFDAMTSATITPALLSHRRILPSENLLSNGSFETWTTGVPNSWVLFGDGAVSQVGARAEVTATNGGIKQTISATALQGLIVALVLTQEIVEGSDLSAGGVRIKTDVGTIGDGRWIDAPYKVNDQQRQFMQFFPVPATATTLTIEVLAGLTGAGTIYLDRAVLVAGDDPKDILT